ncbi:MAG: RNA methyltransferase [Bacteroidales bacterium]|jgi:tRNA G18 (ribose-2'-O)-methylase SpoU
MSFFEIGIFDAKSMDNVGTLWRTAYQLGAAGVFTIGHRYKHMPSDPFRAYRHIPMRNFVDFDQFYQQRPSGAVLVGIEMGGTVLSAFEHPPQAIYLLGAEDYGLPKYVIGKCNLLVSLEAMIKPSYNVAVAGGIVLYDRVFSLKPQSFDALHPVKSTS